MRSSTRSRRQSSFFQSDSHLQSHQRVDSDDSESNISISKRKSTEEDIAEYSAKKAQKEAMKVAKKLKSQTIFGYSNDSNPFTTRNSVILDGISDYMTDHNAFTDVYTDENYRQ